MHTQHKKLKYRVFLSVKDKYTTLILLHFVNIEGKISNTEQQMEPSFIFLPRHYLALLYVHK